MADVLPVDTDRPAIARLDVPRTRYTPSPEELARQAAAAEHQARVAAEQGLTPEEYVRTWCHATEKHWLKDLDVDSVCPFTGASLYPYLTTGGTS
ncbi:hypothetical protein [Streptomyces erythrochromogenes]|uniref:hypothetical protein n=1 Tax=Streptomyces erythrochromogenes TaxID=285574 RepID=UPI0037D62CE0